MEKRFWVIKSRPLRTLQVNSNFNVSLYYNHTIDIREIHKLSLLMYVFIFGIIRYSRMQGKWFLFVLFKKITDIRKIFLRLKISSSVHIGLSDLIKKNQDEYEMYTFR